MHKSPHASSMVCIYEIVKLPLNSHSFTVSNLSGLVFKRIVNIPVPYGIRIP